ncbi:MULTISPECIES: hypothetical protein [Pseudomonas]|jgi:hypothetical protein|uniref:hypothetical protein n=1 Tax=Pseudomonas TaxID=286 RepID=UPI0005E2D46F|nr:MULTISPECIES: hypothetical protein [Pseudomonas]KJH86547.1 hypothetical protein UG46_10790 [Pseudomonas fluorescens]MBI6619384.1 hypothetical protein [Pseudomonas corrugata]MBI6691122.1 hypothetical protein [Pseudomonas corrugata]WRV70359.1 hypothetical protein VQ575_10065 [Pseudomonas frederiksbergensis]
MYLYQKSGRCILLAGALLMSGCTSFLQGKQYVVPGPDEPFATVRLKAGSGARLDAMTFSDNGCYAGYTVLPSNGGYIESRVAVNKELILTYWKVAGNSACQIPFSFTPQKGATYTLIEDFSIKPKAGILPILDRDEYFCGVGVLKKVGDQESVEPIQKLQIKTGFACLKFVK